MSDTPPDAPLVYFQFTYRGDTATAAGRLVYVNGEPFAEPIPSPMPAFPGRVRLFANKLTIVNAAHAGAPAQYQHNGLVVVPD
jgi:hypothetical protein